MQIIGVKAFRIISIVLGIVLSVWIVLNNDSLQAQEVAPAVPDIYSGVAFAGGQPVPDGMVIVAKMGDSFQSDPVTVTDGRFSGLVVDPSSQMIGKKVEFFLEGVVSADQAYIYFGSAIVNLKFRLDFRTIPAPTPTPTPEPTSTPLPTAIPTMTPTPVASNAAVFGGPMVIAGGVVPEGAVLIAKVLDYESLPAMIQIVNGITRYANLVIAPNDPKFIGSDIKFVLNGVSANITAKYESGRFELEFPLVFVGFPTPTATPVPPTATPVPPTATPGSEVQNTLIATGTDEGLTDENGNGSFCVPMPTVSIGTGVANMMTLLAPVALIFGYRRLRRRKTE